MNLKSFAAMAALATAISCPGLAGDEPPGTSRQAYYPSLGDIMGATQLRHFKLWYAGDVNNWKLASYELGQITASFQDATTLYPNILVANMRSMTQPTDEIRAAIAAKDRVKFEKAFEKLTSACNSCHEAAGLGFIEMTVPRRSPLKTSPFSDQSFTPR